MGVECGKVGLCAKTLTHDGEKYGALLGADDKRAFISPSMKANSQISNW